VRSGVVAIRLESNDEVRPRMDCRQSGHLHGVEDAEDVELSFLREVGGIGEDRERDVHDPK